MAATGMDDAIKRWQAFCQGISAAGTDILQSAQQVDDLSQAEGLRYLTRLLRSGIEKFVEYSDPADPCLANVYNTHLKWGLDNPDSLYALAYIDGRREYVVTGNIGTVNYFNFTTTTMATTAKYDIIGVLDSPDVKADANGNFTIYIGGPKRDSNWVALNPDSNSLLVRQTFIDRSKEKEVTFAIKLVADGARNAPLNMQQSLARSEQAQTFFANTGSTFVKLTQTINSEMNRLILVDQQLMLSMGGDPNYAYFWGGYDLQPGEALLIHFPDVPHTETWGLCLYNYWLESLDYTKARINLNKNLAVHNPDGSLTIVVSDEKPAQGNWLDTLGHRRGSIMSRWIKPERVVLPLCEVVRLEGVNWPEKLQRWER
ncbi:MAG: hypothetical protein JWM78_3370 [Verrucomicrobiaceae bacterium]|nr:hypothetical protein [Verrucomicrobiaceae bacterium]